MSINIEVELFKSAINGNDFDLSKIIKININNQTIKLTSNHIYLILKLLDFNINLNDNSNELF